MTPHDYWFDTLEWYQRCGRWFAHRGLIEAWLPHLRLNPAATTPALASAPALAPALAVVPTRSHRRPDPYRRSRRPATTAALLFLALVLAFL